MSKWLSFLPREQGVQNLCPHCLVLAILQHIAGHALNRSLFSRLRLRFGRLGRAGSDDGLIGLLFLAFLLDKSLAALCWVVACFRLVFLRLGALGALSGDSPRRSRDHSLLGDLLWLFGLFILDGRAASAARLVDDSFGTDAAID